MMEIINERAPLIGNTREVSQHQPYEDESDEDNDADESETDDMTLDHLMARFGGAAGPLGLSGAMQGASLMRRGSISEAALPALRRNSYVGIEDGHYRVRRKSIASSSVLERQARRASVASTSRDDPFSVIEIGTMKQPLVGSRGRYLGGVSDTQFWAIFSSILLVYFIACFDSTLMASSHPVITSYFNASNSASWLSTSFLLTSTAFQPIFGRISDTFGRRLPYLLTIAAFALGTIWCAVAQSILSFIFARALCGFGAGGAIALGAIISSDLVPLEIRGSYQSLLNLAFGIGSALGAALGGFLADALGWRWEFGIQVPVILLTFIVSYITTPTILGPQLAMHSNMGLWKTLQGFDLSGSFFLTTSVTFLIIATSLGGNVLPWSDPLIIASLVATVICGALLIVVEKRAAQPIMPLEFLFSRPRGNLIFSNFFACMTMNTILFNLPLYFQAVLLDSPTRSGTRLALPFVFNMAAGFSTGFIITYSTRLTPTLWLGYALMLLGSILLCFMDRSLPEWAYTQFIVASSMGQGFSFPSVSLSVLATSTMEEMAAATSTLVLWRSLGMIMGVAISSLLVQNALVYYLDIFVHGALKEEVIRHVRQSIEAVALLPAAYQDSVIEAYSVSVRVSFIFASVSAALGLFLVLIIRLPKLTKKFEMPASGE